MAPLLVAALLFVIGLGLQGIAWQQSKFCDAREQTNAASTCFDHEVVIAQLQAISPTRLARLDHIFKTLPGYEMIFLKNEFQKSRDAGATTIGMSRQAARYWAEQLKSRANRSLDLTLQPPEALAMLGEVASGREPAEVMKAFKASREARLSHDPQSEALDALANALLSATPISNEEIFKKSSPFRLFSSSAHDPVAWAIEQEDGGSSACKLLLETVVLSSLAVLGSFIAFIIIQVALTAGERAMEALACHSDQLRSEWESEALQKSLPKRKTKLPSSRGRL